ncbi:hypothetical protein BLOT_007489, partial [Blomia tropicalis]
VYNTHHRALNRANVYPLKLVVIPANFDDDVTTKTNQTDKELRSFWVAWGFDSLPIVPSSYKTKRLGSIGINPKKKGFSILIQKPGQMVTVHYIDLMLIEYVTRVLVTRLNLCYQAMNEGV